MKLTVVGCSGSFPGPDSPASSYLLEEEGYRAVLDLGNGALGALQRYASLDAVDAVLVSHLHVDHVIDLCSYYVARRYRPATNGDQPRSGEMLATANRSECPVSARNASRARPRSGSRPTNLFERRTATAVSPDQAGPTLAT